jgi:hypothetical protein
MTVVLLASGAAFASDEASSSSIACAEREALLMTLVEAHGSAPNAASSKLGAESVSLVQARTACDNGHGPDAMALYDRLIAELATSLAQQNK